VVRLPKFASVECIEPLTKMLDDPDVNVREYALEALRKVKSALEERKEWQELVGKLKEGKK
jgi:HEAT repeat protein